MLCEKPFAVSAAESEEMAAAARANGVFLMEAMWTRFLPAWRQVKRWLDEGAIGDVRLINATFGSAAVGTRRAAFSTRSSPGAASST